MHEIIIAVLLTIISGLTVKIYGDYASNAKIAKIQKKKTKKYYKELEDDIPCALKYIKKCVQEKNSVSCIFVPTTFGKFEDKEYNNQKITKNPLIEEEIIESLQSKQFISMSLNSDETYIYKEEFIDLLKKNL
ncbi:MAG: hypothetical protein ACTSSP_03315 [Candidatus Asgardarchaeia archaeon]